MFIYSEVVLKFKVHQRMVVVEPSHMVRHRDAIRAGRLEMLLLGPFIHAGLGHVSQDQFDS